MKRHELEAFLSKCGWKKDAWGHYHKGDLRFKLQKRSVRLERSYRTPDTEYSKGELRYMRLRGGYYSNLSINADGKLAGLTR